LVCCIAAACHQVYYQVKARVIHMLFERYS
jgi:hypothetical protein